MGFLDTAVNLLAEASQRGTMAAGDDATLKTGMPAEASFRNGVPFSDLIITFPVTMPFGGLILPAYLTEFKDNFKPSFTSTEVFGRSDPIPVYKNTTRSISLGFQIPCYDEQDANENLKKLNTFIKNLYPSYKTFGSKGALVQAFNPFSAGSYFSTTTGQILSGPPLIRVKFANLIQNHNNYRGLLGYVTNFNYSFGIKERGVFLHKDGAILPRALEFTFDFGVLHEATIGWDGPNNFFGDNNYPYRPVADFGDTPRNLGRSAGLDEDVANDKILGG